MAGTLNTPAPVTTTELEDVVGGERLGAFGWRRLQAVAAVFTIAAFVVPMVIAGTLEGFLVAMAAPFVVGLVLSVFLPRVAAIFLGIVSLGTLASSAPYTAPTLAHPESVADFIPQVFFALSTLTGAVAAIPAYREIRRGHVETRTPRLVTVAAAAVVVAATIVSVVAATGIENVAALPGDETILTRDFVFAPAKLTADAGSVTIHVTNDDPTRHTFTIDGVTDLSVPPNTTQRVTFEAAPGTYRFYCIPHAPDMDGVLVVE